jgi:hypothetical protein
MSDTGVDGVLVQVSAGLGRDLEARFGAEEVRQVPTEKSMVNTAMTVLDLAGSGSDLITLVVGVTAVPKVAKEIVRRIRRATAEGKPACLTLRHGDEEATLEIASEDDDADCEAKVIEALSSGEGWVKPS